ncbi:MAG: chemotaxis protein CheW [Solirubrobacteraceae bacterium]
MAQATKRPTVTPAVATVTETEPTQASKPPTVVAAEQAASSASHDDARYEQLDTSEFVTFSVAQELFAFPMDRVQEIIRAPETVKVPLAPASLEGLANLRGRVLPIISLRSCAGYAALEQDEATRVIVVDCGVALGFVVDRVAAVIAVDPDQVEDASTINATVDSKLLTGVIKSADGKMIAILDIEKLVDLEFQTITRRLAEQHERGNSAAEVSIEEESDDTLELVSFVVDGQEYSLPIDQVQEIVQAPESVTLVPNADARVVGVIDLRGRLLPVISLRRVFGLEQGELDESNRIIVVPLESDGKRSMVGLLMDTVRAVLRVPYALVDELPGYLAREGAVTEVESVCRLEDGKRLVSVLSTDRMFRRNGLHAAVDQLQRSDEEDTTVNEQTTTRASDDWNDDVEQLVVFHVDGEEYCLTVDAVQEIIRVPEQLVQVPQSLEFVEGLVNLRGAVLPVVDLRARLRLARAERGDLQRIVVLIVGGVRTGFVVDSVTEVLKLSVTAIERAPELSEEQARVISKVANLDDGKRMLLILEADQLLGAAQAAALTENAAQAA